MTNRLALDALATLVLAAVAARLAHATDGFEFVLGAVVGGFAAALFIVDLARHPGER